MLIAARFSGSGSGKDLLSRAISLIASDLLPFSSFPTPARFSGSRFHPRFAGTRIPTLAEVLDWAKRDKMGLVLEIKEAEQPDLAVDRVASLLAATSTLDRLSSSASIMSY